MKDSRKDEVDQGIWGIKRSVLVVPSWRRPNLCQDALEQAAKALDADVEPEVYGRVLLKEASFNQLSLTALAPDRRKIKASLQLASRVLAARLPLGSLRNGEQLLSLLNEYVEAIRKLKQDELVRLKETLGLYAFKRKEVLALREEKARWIATCKGKARTFAKLKKAERDRIYDHSYGTYGKVVGFTVVSRKSCDLNLLKQSIHEHYVQKGYQEVPKSEASPKRDRSNTKTVWIVPAGDLFLVKGLGTDFWIPFSRKASPILDTGNPEFWNDEGWFYTLWENGAETDRHCSAPFLFTELREMVEEGDDPELLRNVVTSWGGSAQTLGRAFGVDPERIRRYLFEFDPEELGMLLDDRPLFIAFKAHEDDHFSLASPWVHYDLLNRLGATTRIYAPEVSNPVEWGNPECLTLTYEMSASSRS
jgi:hypothetical protein